VAANSRRSVLLAAAAAGSLLIGAAGFNWAQNQLDISFARNFPLGHMRVRPTFEIFNALNANPVISAVGTYGPTVFNPRAVLNARLMKINLRLDF